MHCSVLELPSSAWLDRQPMLLPSQDGPRCYQDLEYTERAFERVAAEEMAVHRMQPKKCTTETGIETD